VQTLTSREQKSRALLVLMLSHFYSIDVFLIVFLWSILIQRVVVGDGIDSGRSVVIALSVWIGYCVDRIADGRRLKPDQLHSLRHSFYSKHGREMTCTAISASCVVLLWAFRNAQSYDLLAGVAMVLAAAAYLASVQICHVRSIRYKKELAASFLISLSVFLPSSSWLSVDLGSALRFAVVWSLFLLNCLAVAEIEKVFDQSQGFQSWVSDRFPQGNRMVHPVVGVACATASLTILMLIAGVTPPGFGLSVLGSCVLVVSVWSRFRRVKELERKALVKQLTIGSCLADWGLVIPPFICVLLGMP